MPLNERAIRSRAATAVIPCPGRPLFARFDAPQARPLLSLATRQSGLSILSRARRQRRRAEPDVQHFVRPELVSEAWRGLSWPTQTRSGMTANAWAAHEIRSTLRTGADVSARSHGFVVDRHHHLPTPLL